MAVEDNYGGVRKLFLGLASEISSLNLDHASGAVSISEANFDIIFTEIDISIESADHQEQEIHGPHGDHWSQHVPFTIPKQSLSLLQLVNTWRQKEIVAIVYDHHDQAKMVGSATEPLLLKASKSHGKKVADLNSVQFELTGNTEFQAVYVTIS